MHLASIVSVDKPRADNEESDKPLFQCLVVWERVERPARCWGCKRICRKFDVLRCWRKAKEHKTRVIFITTMGLRVSKAQGEIKKPRDLAYHRRCGTPPNALNIGDPAGSLNSIDCTCACLLSRCCIHLMVVSTPRTTNAQSSSAQNRSMYIAIDQFPVDAGRLLHVNDAWWEQRKRGLSRWSHI